MSSRQKDDQKAESILHHLLRLGSKVTNPIKKRRRKRFWKKRLKELQRQTSSSSLATHTSTYHGSSSAFLSLYNSHSCFDDETPNTQEISKEDQEDYLDDLLSVTSSDYQQDNLLKAIDQNELLVECFMGNDESSDTTFVVHFFNEETTLSEEIDSFLETQLRDNTSTSNWKCRRVNARLAPLFAKILDIDPEQPTVVAIKDGIMVTKQTELTSPVVEQLERWLTATASILSGEQEFADIVDYDYDDDDSDDDYLVECFMGNDDNSDTIFIIHFFNEDDSNLSEQIDNFLETQLLADSPFSNWEYRRVNAQEASLFANILDIDPEQPTVVAIKDGIMVTKQTDLSSQSLESQLERWMIATESILSGDQEHMYNSLSGDSSKLLSSEGGGNGVEEAEDIVETEYLPMRATENVSEDRRGNDEDLSNDEDSSDDVEDSSSEGEFSDSDDDLSSSDDDHSSSDDDFSSDES